MGFGEQGNIGKYLGDETARMCRFIWAFVIFPENIFSHDAAQFVSDYNDAKSERHRSNL